MDDWHIRRKFIIIRFKWGVTLDTCVYHLLKNCITKPRFALTSHVVQMYMMIKNAVLTFVAIKREVIDGMTWNSKSVLFHHVDLGRKCMSRPSSMCRSIKTLDSRRIISFANFKNCCRYLNYTSWLILIILDGIERRSP